MTASLALAMAAAVLAGAALPASGDLALLVFDDLALPEAVPAEVAEAVKRALGIEQFKLTACRGNRAEIGAGFDAVGDGAVGGSVQ